MLNLLYFNLFFVLKLQILINTSKYFFKVSLVTPNYLLISLYILSILDCRFIIVPEELLISET